MVLAIAVVAHTDDGSGDGGDLSHGSGDGCVVVPRASSVEFLM
jgi:hypothetical protein